MRKALNSRALVSRCQLEVSPAVFLAKARFATTVVIPFLLTARPGVQQSSSGEGEEVKLITRTARFSL